MNRRSFIIRSYWFSCMLLGILFLFVQYHEQYEIKSGILSQSRSNSQHERNSTPILLPTDLIYHPSGWGNPIIITEYKLVFFTIPKVACTDWKLLFRRIEGQPEWNRTVQPLKLLHQPVTNNLTILSNLPIGVAQHILTSPEWTRAVFVREPKERVLSAFLNKFIDDSYYFFQKCCRDRGEDVKEECRIKKNHTSFTYFLNRTRDCHNDHWNPQYASIDTKWWNTINFVGYMDNIEKDSKQLLQSITSSKDGVSAWDRYGRTGWGTNGNNSFMKMDTEGHATNASGKLLQYYTRTHEKFVEKHWAGEWNHSVYHFNPLHLYDDSLNHGRR